MSAAQQHTPPLGYHFLTPFYDGAIATLTRERVWRSELVRLINPVPDDFIVDVGSGTGSLALALRGAESEHSYLGIDPDEKAVSLARKKLLDFKKISEFNSGYLTERSLAYRNAPTKFVSSLVLHQVALAEKSRILETMFALLAPGGKVVIADYGQQNTRVSKALFRMTVQALDGVENTQPNANGIIPILIEAAGFEQVVNAKHVVTPTGTISICTGVKSLITKKKGD